MSQDVIRHWSLEGLPVAAYPFSCEECPGHGLITSRADVANPFRRLMRLFQSRQRFVANLKPFTSRLPNTVAKYRRWVATLSKLKGHSANAFPSSGLALCSLEPLHFFALTGDAYRPCHVCVAMG